MIGHAHRRDFSFHLSHTIHTHWDKPVTITPSQPPVATQVLVSMGSLKTLRGGWENLWTVVLFPRADLPSATQIGSCSIVIQFRIFKNVQKVAPAVIGHTIIYKWNGAAADHLGLTRFILEQSRGWTHHWWWSFSLEIFLCNIANIRNSSSKYFASTDGCWGGRPLRTAMSILETIVLVFNSAVR